MWPAGRSSPLQHGPGERGPGELRVVTYNLHDLLDDRAAVAHVLRCCRADVVCLQEAPRRPLTAHRLRRLARETGLVWAAGGRASGGTAILVHPRLQVVHAQAERLPVAGALTRTRGYVLVTVQDRHGHRLSAVSVHLPLRSDERVEHCRRVRRRLSEFVDLPYLVAGDLNEPPQGPAWAQLSAVVQDAASALTAVADLTFPSRAPRARIDGVLVSSGVRVGGLRVAGEQDGLSSAVLRAASDHLPLLADLTVGRAPA